MIKFFSEEWRGIGEQGEQRGIIFSFDFRNKLHLFNGAKLHVLMAIILHTDKRGICWPSYDLLEKETGYTRSTIAGAIKELCELEIDGCKIMVKWRERDKKGKFIKGNYYLVFPTQEELDTQSMIFPTLEKSNGGKIILEDNTDLKEKNIEKGDSEKNFYLAVCADVENKLGIMPTIMLEKSIKDAIAIYPEQWITAAIDKAAKNKARNWRYVEVVLENWQKDGKQDQQPISNGKYHLPDNLDTHMFKRAWELWQQHMKEKGRPLTPTSIELQLQELSEWGEDRAIEAINLSVRKGWLSINEPNDNQQSDQSDQPYKGYLPGR